LRDACKIGLTSLFDFDGELLATTSTPGTNMMIIKTTISSWFDFSDLGTIDEGSVANLRSMTFELEVVLLY
jgi:hypothetical protein